MIECIPNFSEGRDQNVIAAIVAAIADVVGVAVLDLHSDADHHRSVVTFAGQQEAVGEAAFRAAATAARLINLDVHRGQHPRIGAIDVVPFVPLHGSSMADCIALSHLVGRRIGDELGIPVYLYEESATRPERRALPDVRRGDYEGLKQAILTDPTRAPDYGPPRLGPAGAVAVGARQPLIAYNVFLASDDLKVARAVARAVRASSGGLPAVRALGMLVGGRAQVSMNLVDFRETPVHEAVEAVRREAARYGVALEECELVGLMPEDALIEAARYYLRLPHVTDAHILERRVRSALRTDE
jgi:glutamate formiminotransferase